MFSDAALKRSPLRVRMGVQLLRAVFLLLEHANKRLATQLAVRLFLTPPRGPASRWEQEFEQRGACVRVAFRGEQLRVLRHGTGQRAALLIHGWGSRGTHLGSYAERLAAAGYCVYSMDGPAHGQSDGARTDIIAFADAIATVARSIPAIDAVIGHSFGAACALVAIDRFALSTNRLVLISCFADPRFLVNAFTSVFRIGPAGRQRILRTLESDYGHAMQWDEVAPKKIIGRFDKPVLLIHDLLDDEVPPDHAKALHNNNRHASVFHTKGQGHRKILRDPSGIEATLAFLSETPQPRGLA
jgi:pimeloyl-ACP methyl ester carboxylesterase